MTDLEKLDKLLNDIESDISHAEIRLSDCNDAIRNIRTLLEGGKIGFNKEEVAMEKYREELRAMGK